MKATEYQKKTIDSVLSIIKTWKNTNDFNSPTHYGDIGEILYADLYDTINIVDIEYISEKLKELLTLIKHSTEYDERILLSLIKAQVRYL